LKVIAMKEEPWNTTLLSERDGLIVQKIISSPSAFLGIESPRSVMEKRGLWILGIMKRLGLRIEGPTPSSYPNKNENSPQGPFGP
jgi:hypothetical protein